MAENTTKKSRQTVKGQKKTTRIQKSKKMQSKKDCTPCEVCGVMHFSDTSGNKWIQCSGCDVVDGYPGVIQGALASNCSTFRTVILSAYVVGQNKFAVLKNFLYSRGLFTWSVPVLLTMSKRLLMSVAHSTKVITIDGSVDANVLKEVICGILSTYMVYNLLYFTHSILYREEALSAICFLCAIAYKPML